MRRRGAGGAGAEFAAITAGFGGNVRPAGRDGDAAERGNVRGGVVFADSVVWEFPGDRDSAE